jgi:hypothetical protein
MNLWECAVIYVMRKGVHVKPHREGGGLEKNAGTM